MAFNPGPFGRAGPAWDWGEDWQNADFRADTERRRDRRRESSRPTDHDFRTRSRARETDRREPSPSRDRRRNDPFSGMEPFMAKEMAELDRMMNGLGTRFQADIFGTIPSPFGQTAPGRDQNYNGYVPGAPPGRTDAYPTTSGQTTTGRRRSYTGYVPTPPPPPRTERRPDPSGQTAAGRGQGYNTGYVPNPAPGGSPYGQTAAGSGRAHPGGTDRYPHSSGQRGPERGRGYGNRTGPYPNATGTFTRERTGTGQRDPSPPRRPYSRSGTRPPDWDEGRQTKQPKKKEPFRYVYVGTEDPDGNIIDSP